ncbi:MAG: phosphoesterase [Kofleriaceae bacterium]|nr:phosphoesterase [Myxococcales bacterium]MCB9560003.1 phosphoesterase [Kofleriaceae bacterium]MCB9571946.1 phosphoesterase [Kofleriaceae bacterium]
MDLKLFFHDRCFDGTASAGLFARFHREVIAADSHAIPVGLRHRDGDPFEGVAIDGDDNACVDFRYSPSPAMRWWFDHHATAFQPPTLRADFEARPAETRRFDPAAPSCAGLIARTLQERWGWVPPPALAEVVRWAEIIDAAAFASAEEAISLAAPAQRLAAWIATVGDDALVARYVAALADGVALEELDRAPWVRRDLEPLLAGRDRAKDALATLGRPIDDVVLFDLLDHPEVPAPGFLGYALFPACRYSVSAARHHGAIKIAVGHNPFAAPRGHDIGALCERYGGGGHAAVGGVTLDADEVDRARATVAAMVEVLTSPAA